MITRVALEDDLGVTGQTAATTLKHQDAAISAVMVLKSTDSENLGATN